jgi:hypothetical protein
MVPDTQNRWALDNISGTAAVFVFMSGERDNYSVGSLGRM